MTSQDIKLFQILLEQAGIELPVKYEEPGHNECEINAANDSMKIYDEGGHTWEQAKYIAHLLNNAPAWVAEIQRLQRENTSYRNYIRSAPDHTANTGEQHGIR